jgi:cellulose synthase/poly-beta-1,6-N-acetylglucosamine synthase-like glycosyltransferase
MKKQLTKPTVYIALPCMDEFENIDKVLTCVKSQTYAKLHLFVCVNQPEKYHHAPAYSHIVEGNAKTIEYLQKEKDTPITIIDKSSKGMGWDEKNYGVGWARKVLFDSIEAVADNEDVVVSMDADTFFQSDYLEAIVKTFQELPIVSAISVPYYHCLSGDEMLDRLMLRYELYMRYYALNLWRIKSPYSFTALGSAIAFSMSAFRKIKGVAPKMSGEDFYLLQKLRKNGRIIHYCNAKVYPATRYSDRVFFGTGPALIKGKSGDWSSYPFYYPDMFDKIKEFYDALQSLFYENIDTPLDDFIEMSLGNNPKLLWDELRSQNNDIQRFEHACHIKFDGLRILQFLRHKHFSNNTLMREEEVIKHFMKTHYSQIFKEHLSVFQEFDLKTSAIENLNKIRDIFEQIELTYRKNDAMQLNESFQQNQTHQWKYLNS